MPGDGQCPSGEPVALRFLRHLGSQRMVQQNAGRQGEEPAPPATSGRPQGRRPSSRMFRASPEAEEAEYGKDNDDCSHEPDDVVHVFSPNIGARSRRLRRSPSQVGCGRRCASCCASRPRPTEANDLRSGHGPTVSRAPDRSRNGTSHPLLAIGLSPACQRLLRSLGGPPRPFFRASLSSRFRRRSES